MVFARSLEDLPPHYKSEGKILYNEESGEDYPFDTMIGQYRDPLTGNIVIRKEFYLQNMGGYQPTGKSYNVRDIVYLLTDMESSWKINEIVGKNIIIENNTTGDVKVVDRDSITHTRPMVASVIPQQNPSLPTQNPTIHFEPHIIISSGEKSQISTTPATGTLTQGLSQGLSPSLSPITSIDNTGSSDNVIEGGGREVNFDAPIIRQPKPEKPQSLLSMLTSGFTVKKV